MTKRSTVRSPGGRVRVHLDNDKQLCPGGRDRELPEWRDGDVEPMPGIGQGGATQLSCPFLWIACLRA